MTNSIAQFLQIISFLDLGVGAVVQSSLWMVLFDSRNNIKWSIKKVVKLFAFDILNVLLIILATSFINSDVADFLEWFILAVEYGVIGVIVLIFSNVVFYNKNVKRMIDYIKSKGK